MSGDFVPWEVADEWERRADFVEVVALVGNVAEVCRRFGISRKTGYKWLRRYEAEGDGGLGDRSRRPHSSPSRTPLWVEEAVCEIRRAHRRWGGRKIRLVMLKRGDEVVPAESTITDILRRHGLLNDEEVEATSRRFVRFEAESPNDLWQMDFKGWFMTGDGRCDPFDVLDDHSRFSLGLSAYGDQQESTTKQLLTGVFGEYGLPRRILCDNGSPWANTQEGHRWTALGVWLLDVGVELVHTSVRHPQTIGKDERFHRTLGLEVLSLRERWDSHHQVQEEFDRWRPVYNYQRPHDALGGKVPGDRYQPSQQEMPTRIQEVEYPDEYHTRHVSGDAQISFQSRRFRIGKAFIGRNVGIHPTSQDGVFNVYYRATPITTIHMP